MHPNLIKLKEALDSILRIEQEKNKNKKAIVGYRKGKIKVITLIKKE